MVNLEHAEVTEKGTHFKTGESLVLPVTHRRQKTQRFGARYGQDIEPVGRYVLHGHLGTSGTQDEGGGHKVTTVHDMVHFRNPLVIRHGGTGSEPGMWKRRLSDHYGGKTGRALSRALAKAGFDAVVTVDSYTRQGKTTFYTSEIVDLTNLRRNPFKSQAQRGEFVSKSVDPEKELYLGDIRVEGKVIPVFLDPKDGIGQVPWNQSINYMGFVAYMTPGEFLTLNPSRELPTGKLTSLMLSQDELRIGPPFITVKWNEEAGQWSITGHEGRGRMEVLDTYMRDEKIPVHFFPRRDNYDTLRARDVTDEMLFADIVSDPRGDSSFVFSPAKVILKGKTRMVKRNPFKSQAQRRLFYAKAKRGEISPKVVREWERETGKRKLPERANSRRANGYQAEDTALSPKEREVIRVVEKALPDCKDSCWIATEVIYHLLDGKRDGYEALEVLHEGSRHWFLRTPRGGIIDVTAQQFDDENIPYEEGRPRPGLSPATLTQSAHADDLIASNRALKSLWYEKEDADWRRRQKERKLPERANPSHGPSRKALKRYEATHWGIESDRTIRVNDADLPRELVEMGKLKELGVTPEDATKPYALDFPNYEKTSLSFSQGKDQRLYNVVPPDVQRALKQGYWKAGEPTVRLGEVNKLTGGRQDKFRCPTIQVQVLGRCNYVIYQTRKLDDFKKDGQASNYIHEFGEESGILPYLCIANDGTLWFAGGNYTILDGGIAD